MPKITIIIPVYNAGDYLRECLDSIVKQTLKDIEVICVNDGSTDNSEKILEEYAAKDSRIKLITQENQGQGISRNNAIKAASGEYLAFVDQDDFVELDMFEVLYASAKKFDSDLVESAWKQYNDYYKKIEKIGQYPLPEDVAFDWRISTHMVFYRTVVWAKLFRTFFVKTNNINFANARVNEDLIFILKSRILSSKISYCNKPMYCHRNHASAGKRISTEPLMYPDLLLEIKNFLADKGIYDELEYEFQKWASLSSFINFKLTPQNLIEEFETKLQNVFSKEMYEKYKELKYQKGIKPIERIFSVKGCEQAGIKYKLVTLFGLSFKIKQSYKASRNFNEPVDLVYLWCDGSDKEWNAKKTEYLQKLNKSMNNQFTNECRFTNNDELKISLRSVEKYAPWINNIYIITDNQVPAWLNINHPKIKIVNHKDIIPEENLPYFNSNAIETYLHKIPGLSEYFLYANDDMFFNYPVNKKFFFTPDGNPIVRMKRMSRKEVIKHSPYLQSIVEMHKWIQDRYDKRIYLQPHHNIDAYTKSVCEDCELEFRVKYEICRKNHFRDKTDVQRILISDNAICQGRAILKRVHKVDTELPLLKRFYNMLTGKFQMDSRYISMTNRDYQALFNRYKPKLVCINDIERTTNDDRQKAKEFLYGLFPVPSVFELKN